jgi:hypothetical protein
MSDTRSDVIKRVRAVMYRDDALETIVPSDLRVLIGTIDRLRERAQPTLVEEERQFMLRVEYSLRHARSQGCPAIGAVLSYGDARFFLAIIDRLTSAGGGNNDRLFGGSARLDGHTG